MAAADPLSGLLRKILTARVGDSLKPERVDADYLVSMWRDVDAGEDRIAWLLERLLPKCDGFDDLPPGWICSLEGAGSGIRISWQGPDGARGETGLDQMAATIRSRMVLGPAKDTTPQAECPSGRQMSLF